MVPLRSARSLVERLTRHWVYRRRLPDGFGSAPIYVTPAAGLKYLFRSMAQTDPHLLRNASDLVRPGDVAWDIGANIGLFTFAAAARAGRQGSVVAFEPDIWLAQILRRSAAIQPPASAGVTIIPAAVASTLSIRSFAIASRSRASNALAEYGHSQMGSVSETQSIVALNLDWLARQFPPPHVIKCDVEGAEAEVFAGQTAMLKDIRPVIICEVGRAAAQQMTDILTGAGYRLYDGEKPLSGQTEVERAVWNTLAIPKERLQNYISSG